MSITAANASYTAAGTGPSETLQVLANYQGGNLARAIYGTAEAILDGTLTAFNVNFIDGTKELSFTPSVVMVSRIPSSAATDAATTIVPSQVSAIDSKTFTVQISAAGTNTHKLRIAFIAY